MNKNELTISDYTVTVSRILNDCEIFDSHDIDMIHDGRNPKGNDKYISVKDLETRLVNRINTLKNSALGQRGYPASNIEREAMNRLDGEIETLIKLLDELPKQTRKLPPLDV